MIRMEVGSERNAANQAFTALGDVESNTLTLREPSFHKTSLLGCAEWEIRAVSHQYKSKIMPCQDVN